MLVSATILALYAWAYLAHVSEIGAGLLVNDVAALTAGVALVAGVVSYLWAPQKYNFWGSYGAFALLCAMIATLVLSTGGIMSPFIALWMLAAVFAGIFGLYGLVPMLLLSLTPAPSTTP